MYFIVGNVSDDSLALIEWIKQKKYHDVYCLYVNTKWASPRWQKRVITVEAWLKPSNITFVTLHAKIGFAELVKQQNTFPNPAFASCVSMIKACTLLDWIESKDPRRMGRVILPKRRAAAMAFRGIPEWVEKSEHYHGRQLWHPLYTHTDRARNALLHQAGFSPTGIQSQECFPCIHCPEQRTLVDQKRDADIKQLEADIGAPFLPGVNVSPQVATKTQNACLSESLASSCGSPYGCGI